MGLCNKVDKENCQNLKPLKIKNDDILLIYIYKVVISVCPIITKEPLDRFVSNFDWGPRENHGNVLSLVEFVDFHSLKLVSR